MALSLNSDISKFCFKVIIWKPFPYITSIILSPTIPQNSTVNSFPSWALA